MGLAAMLPAVASWAGDRLEVLRLRGALSEEAGHSEVFCPHSGTSHPPLSFPTPADARQSSEELRMLDLATGAS